MGSDSRTGLSQTRLAKEWMYLCKGLKFVSSRAYFLSVSIYQGDYSSYPVCFLGLICIPLATRLFISTSTRGQEIEYESMPAILIKEFSDKQKWNVSWLSPWISYIESLHPLLRISSVPHSNRDLFQCIDTINIFFK